MRAPRFNAHRVPRRRARLVIGLFLIALLGGVLLWARGPAAVAERIREQAVASLSRALGREVRAGEAELKLFPLELRVRDVQVAGAPGEPPLANARRISARPLLGPLLRSRGHAFQIARLEVDGLEVNLPRRRDGTWSLPKPGATSEPAPEGQSPPPTFERIRLVDATVRLVDEADGVQRVLLTRIDASASDVGPGRPLDVRVRAEQEDGQGTLKARLSLDRLPEHGLRPGEWPALRGDVDVRRIRIQPFASVLPEAIARAASGGELSMKLKVRSRKDRPYAVDGDVELSGLALKGADTGTRFALSGTVDPWRPDASNLELTQVRAHGPGFDVKGKVTVLGFTRARFALAGKVLDLRVLLAPDRPRPRRPGEAQPWAPLATRRVLRKLDLSGSLAFDELRVGKLAFTQVRSDALLADGVLRLRSGTGFIYGGAVDAEGSWMDLGPPTPPWRITARLDDVQSGEALRALVGGRKVVGAVDGDLFLEGTGTRWPALRSSLHGSGRLAMRQGTLDTIDLNQKLAPILRRPLGPAARILERGMPFAHGSASFVVRDGWLSLQEPLRLESPFGPFAAVGRIALDGALDLQGLVQVSPEFATRVVGRLLRPREPVDVPLAFGGTLEQPEVHTRPVSIVRELLSGGHVKSRALGRPAPPGR